MKKLTGILLLATIVAQIVSCSDSTLPPQNDGISQDTSIDSVESNESELDSLPADLRFDNETVSILYRGREEFANYDVIGDETGSDLVYSAVYNRNQKVKERLGIDFEFIAAPGGMGDALNYFKTTVLSGSDGVDLIWATGNTLIFSGLNDAFYDLSESKYLDLDKDYWNLSAMKEMSIDGETLNYLYGNLMLVGLRQTGLMYFNKDMYTDLYGDPDQLYKTVLDGNWTLDKFNDLCKDVYTDLNGNGKVDEDADRFATIFSSSTEENLTHFVYSSDFKTYERKDNGMPVIDMSSDRSVSIAVKFCETFVKTNPDYLFSSRSLSDSSIYNIFAEGRLLFFPERFYASTLPVFRDMKDKYGMIPYPKFDENQSEYLNLIHNSGTVATIPKTLSEDRFEMVCATLEAMASEQSVSVLPVFYETALKTKYSRDELSSQVIDLVYSCSTKDLVSEYGSLLNYIYALPAKCVLNELPFSSTYASAVTSANSALQNLFEEIAE